MIFKVEKVAKKRQKLQFLGLLSDFWVSDLKKVEKKCEILPRNFAFYPVFLTFSVLPGGPETRIFGF